MKVTACSLLAVLLGVGSAVAVGPHTYTKGASSRFAANRYIIEVASTSDLPGKRSPGSAHEALYSSLRQRGVGFTVDKEYNSEGLFVGAAVSLSSPNDYDALLSTPGVQAVRPVVFIPAPKPFKVLMGHPGHSGSKQPVDTESTHVITNVDKVHAMGITGKGVKIGIIDTGIDYTHPALGGGIGKGFKIIGGYDFVGDNYTGFNTPVPDNDPLDQCNGHGTHVGGIIGANPGNQFNISGVAYDASITAYRIFGCPAEGQVTDDIIVDALLRGVQDGQDILTMSLGGTDGWTESSSAVVSSRISASGKIVTIAAGNDGDLGSWYTSSPGNAIDSISVASLDNPVIPLQNATLHGVTHPPIPYYHLFPLPTSEALPVYATSTNTTIVDDACDPLPDSTPDLSGFLTVIRRGTCTFVQKLQNAADKGANFVFIYDNGGGFASIDTGNFTNAALIQEDDGAFLVSQFAAGVNVTVSFPQTGGLYNFPDPHGGLISTFTSFGPSNDMFFKPAIAAPGGNVLSTYPVPLGSFAVLSGTSMATPFMAGSSALLFSVKGKSSSVGLGARSLFETTANYVGSDNSGGPLQTATQQGAGLVNVLKALQTETIISPAELLCNDTAHFKGTHTIHIKNTGKSTKQYTFKHVPAGTAETVAAGDILVNDGPIPQDTKYAQVSFSSSHVTVHPGQTGSLTINIHPPKVDAKLYPVYSGFVQLTDNTGETTHVSYLGVGATLKDKQILDTTDEFFGFPLPTVLDSTGNPQTNATNYTFIGADFPTLLVRFAFGTLRFTVDVVSPNEKVSSSGSYSSVKTLGQFSEMDYIPRSGDAADVAHNGWTEFDITTPVFANGKTIPNGAYRLLLRALKVNGNPSKESDYETYLSPVIGINQ